MLNNFFSENRNVYEIMWKKNVQPTGHKNTHSEYVTFIAFPLQQ